MQKAIVIISTALALVVLTAQIAVSSLLSRVGQPSAVSVDFACPINFTIRDAQGAHVIISEGHKERAAAAKFPLRLFRSAHVRSGMIVQRETSRTEAP